MLRFIVCANEAYVCVPKMRLQARNPNTSFPRHGGVLQKMVEADTMQKMCNEFANFCAENLHDLGGVGAA